MSNSLIKNTAATKARKNTTPQTVKADEAQVKNNAGGFTFVVSDRDRLERFLILGTDGGTYYVSEKKITDQNIAFLRNLLSQDERLVVDAAVDVSVNGRAYKNSPAIFAIALALTEGKDKEYAREAFNKVVRTGTHLFEAVEYINNLGGWGRAKRKAVAGWYESKDADSQAYQTVKYRQRNGWTHKDVLRLSHAKPDPYVANFALGKKVVSDDKPQVISGFEAAQSAGSEKEVISVLETYKNLPWEAIPTEFLKSDKVWKTLFYNNQLNGQALVRNIVRLSRLNAFNDMQFAADYAKRLTDEEMIKKTRLHPINYLNAVVVYEQGQIERQGNYGYYGGSRKKDWQTSSVIIDALNEGFHSSFKSVEPAGKRTLEAIDVSGSMSSPAIGLDLSCAQVSAAIAMTIARTEPAHIIRGFTTGSGSRYNWRGTAELTDLGISAKTSLSSAMSKVRKNNFGGTDCAMPMIWALENKVEVDTFVVVTDNETWAGSIHPHQALKKYRDQMGIDARLAVLGVASTEFTIADPKDKGMMDFVGFDSNAPRVLADFSAGRL